MENIEVKDISSCKTELLQGTAKIFHLKSRAELGEKGSLLLELIKPSLNTDCSLSSKILPTIVVLKRKSKSGSANIIEWNAYTFDTKERCLARTYLNYQDGHQIGSGKYDTSTATLKYYGDVIQEMINRLSDEHIPHQLAIDPTFQSLRQNNL